MFFVAFESFAQAEQGVFSIKPAAGITVANLTGSGASSKIGFTGGAELAYQATFILGLSAGVMYSMEGAKDDINTDFGRFDAKANLSYLNIPVMANFYVFYDLALKIGVQPAFLLKAEVKLDGVKAKNKREQAILDILKGDFAAADLLIEEALAVNPSDVVWLNLKAAKAAHAGNLEEAEGALDLAIMTSPRSYCAYYNMVLLTLKKNPDAKDSARRYYETGRTYNGPKDETLEALFK